MGRKRALPLDGILVADFSRVLAGPLCTQLLGDWGARVIKVEALGGDETRRWGPPFVGDVSAYFLSINRNKESIAIDLKSEEGVEVARRLIERADVVVDNFLPAQKESLHFAPREINSRIVHCTIAGFDSDTDDANTPGYDLLAQAGSGLMSITGDAAGEPMKIGVALADVLTAHYAFGAICAALRAGEGASIEVSLFSATIASLANVAQNVLVTGKEAARYGNAHPSIVPYQVFHGSDRAFAIGVGTDRHFAQLCERVLRRPKLAHDERFATNTQRVKDREVLVAILEDAFHERTAAQWVARCRRAAIPASLVRGVREALRTAAARALIASVEHPQIGAYDAIRNPVLIDGERFDIGSAPPSLGQHTEAIAKEFSASNTKKSGARSNPPSRRRAR
ncbi:MAG TPA: CoA transferase [Thermoanaerobaculia bacterium]|jgi:crotonobetainyl-CoA:carnitine CoA-transferase CaiB-like acyl-CoA transferase|nr:CoA transferase [Thermoanaerobaculia bacterium]